MNLKKVILMYGNKQDQECTPDHFEYHFAPSRKSLSQKKRFDHVLCTDSHKMSSF